MQDILSGLVKIIPACYGGQEMTDNRQIAAQKSTAERHKDFVMSVLAGASIPAASRSAGYSESYGYTLISAPSVAAAVEAGLRRQLLFEAAPLAISTLIHLVKCGGSERIKHDAAKTLLDRAGFVLPTRTHEDKGEKQLTELSREELHAAMLEHEKEIDSLEAELAARAEPLNEPNEAEVDDKPASFLD